MSTAAPSRCIGIVPLDLNENVKNYKGSGKSLRDYYQCEYGKIRELVRRGKVKDIARAHPGSSITYEPGNGYWSSVLEHIQNFLKYVETGVVVVEDKPKKRKCNPVCNSTDSKKGSKRARKKGGEKSEIRQLEDTQTVEEGSDGDDSGSICSGATQVLESACKHLDDYETESAMKSRYQAYIDTLAKEERETNQRLYPHVEGVYMGRVFPYTNFKRSVSTRELNQLIDQEFKTMRSRDYETHPLRAFFERRKDADFGYIPIMIPCKTTGARERMGSVDHVLPKAYSFFEHPRFYMYVHKRINSHMGDNTPPEYRITAGLKRAEVGEIKILVKGMKANKVVKSAFEQMYSEFSEKADVRKMC
jgi:hypothetical protein